MPSLYLVAKGLISLSELSKMVSLLPSQMIQKNAGLIKEGFLADFVIFDTLQSSEVNNPQSLYYKQSLQGKIVCMFIEGVETSLY